MAHWRARILAFALLCGCAAMAYPRTARAFSCTPPRQLTPLDGAVVPSDTLIWDVCYYTDIDGTPRTLQEPVLCSPPSLTDHEGQPIELIVEQQVRSARYARTLTAYRPGTPLVVGGRYRLDASVSYNDISQEFSVVEPAPGLPAAPVVAAVDFSVNSASLSGGAFEARFIFEPFEGTLVADPEGTLASAFEGLEISWWQRAAGKKPIYYLANESCYVNFAEATWGAPASVRFGVMDLAGNFSGWSEPTFIEYPVDETTYPDALPRPYVFAKHSSACSLAGGPPSVQGIGLLVGVVVAGAVRRARSRSLLDKNVLAQCERLLRLVAGRASPRHRKSTLPQRFW